MTQGARLSGAERARGLADALLGRMPAWLLLLVLLLLSGPPMIAVAISSFQTGVLTPNVAWTLDNYRAIAAELGVEGPVEITLVVAVGAASVALLLGGVLAFIVERTNTPFRALGYVVAIIVVALPAAVYAVAWSLLFSRRGLANVALAWLGAQIGVDLGPIDIGNMAGMIAVEGFHYAPLAFLLLSGPIRSVDRSLEEAALTSGAGAVRTFLHVTGPLLLPAIVAVLLLTFIRAIEAFAIPAIIGLPGRVSVITTEIYFSAVQSLPPRYGLASAHGVVLVAIVILFLYVYGTVTAQGARFATVTGKGFKARIIELGWQRYLLLGVLVLYLVVLVVLPLVVLVWASLQRFYAGVTFRNLSFEHYARLFDYPQIALSFLDSLVVGLLTAAIIMALTTAAAWVSVRGRGGPRRLMDFAVSLPLVLPGIVLGLALLQIYANSPVPVYGTLAVLVIASVTRFIPFGYRYAHAGLLQIHPELEEAGLLSGASRLQVVLRIVLPLVALPLVAGFIYVFLISVRELEASILLVTSRTPMVAPILMDLFENGFIPQVAAFSTVIVLVFGAFGILFYSIAKRYGLGVQ